MRIVTGLILGLAFTSLLSVSSTVLASAQSPTEDPAAADSAGAADSVSAAASTDGFAFKLFKLVTKDQKDESVVVSPFSVSSALSMALNGAQGQTEKEMRETLGLQGGETEINQRYLDLSTSLLEVNPKSELAIANAAFAKQGVSFRQPFIDANQRFYSAQLQTLDFSDPATVGVINGWVNKQTKSKIPTIIDKVPSEAILYLINAVYFKGTWQDEFQEAGTEEATFKTSGGAQKQVKMMNRTDSFRYLRGSNFQAVKLPYQDKRLEMVVFLPDKNVDFATFNASFSADNWQKWIPRFGKHTGHLGLPRFKIEYQKELSTALKEAGMPCAFKDGCADFSKMTSESALISAVIHKTFMEVNEKGTEAAAVTAVEVGVTSVAIDVQPPFEMICDRPFVIALRDSKTDTILFLGSIASIPGN